MTNINYPGLDGFNPKQIAYDAIISANSDYASLSEIEQARYRLNLSEPDGAVINESIRQVVCAYIKTHTHLVLDVPNSVGKTCKTFLYNWCCLYVNTGSGQPLSSIAFELDVKRVLDPELTVFTYDLEDHNQQNALRKEDDWPEREYRLLRSAPWVRGLYKGKFYYITIWSLSEYIATLVEDRASELVDEYAPHEYTETVEKIDSKSGEYSMHLELDANGKKAEYEALRYKVYSLREATDKRVSDEQLSVFPKVYIKVGYDDDSPYEPALELIINNPEAARKIRLSNLIGDAEKLLSDLSEVEVLSSQALDECTEKMHQAYMDIINE